MTQFYDDQFSQHNLAMHGRHQALEEAESSLLGGFFYRHYLLACNVIGSDSHGTMKRAVQALKASFQIPIFPTLDRVRSNLGKEVDARLAHLQGRIMKRIDESIMPTSPRPRPSASLSDASTAIIAARDGDGYDDLLLQELSFSDREERRQASADQAREELYSTRDVPRGDDSESPEAATLSLERSLRLVKCKVNPWPRHLYSL
jgi:hypothetical protein